MKVRHSLSGKLIALFLLTGAALALVVQLGLRVAVWDAVREAAQPHLAEYANHLLNELGAPPTPERARALAQRLPLDIYLGGPHLEWSSTGQPPELGDRRFHTHRLAGGRTVRVAGRRGDWLLVSDQGGYRIVLMPRDLDAGAGTALAGLLTVGAVLGVLLLAYHGIRRLFQPLRAISDGVRRFGAGELAHRIRVRRRDELGELTDAVNTMAGEIQHMLEAKRQLLLAVSHELRSPLTRAKVNLALLDDSPARQALGGDLDEVERLLTELLEGERLNQRHAALDRQAVDPGALVREVIGDHFRDRPLLVKLEETRWISLDPVRIRLLVRNLLDNALRHTPAASAPPEVSAAVLADHWVLRVIDHGPGIAAEHLPYLTEPFYRADPARQRQTGGYGLGLYLCRMIAEAHDGRLQITSRPGQGTEVEVRFPL